MSVLMSTFYFGGYNAPWIQDLTIIKESEILRPLIQFGALFVKTLFFIFFFVWVRWSVPRFRYDQLMDLGWKVMLPLAVLNVVVTAIILNFI